MPNAAAADLAHDLEDLHLASSRVQAHVDRRRVELAREAESLDADLLPALLEWAAAEADVEAHCARWAGVPYDGDAPESVQQRAEWSPICERSYRWQARILTVARHLRAEAQREQLQLPASKPAAAVQPESRL